jgi:hypothetical protein
VETVPNPAFGYLQDQVRMRLAEYFTAHPGAVPAEVRPVQITADGFTLIYKELGDADTQYELRQTQHVGFPYTRKLLRLVGGEGVQCQVDAPVAAPWKPGRPTTMRWSSRRPSATATSAWPGSWKRCRRCSRTVPPLRHRFRRSLRAPARAPTPVDAGDHSPHRRPGAGRRAG